MKKILIAVLLISLALTLMACGPDDTDETTDTTSVTQPTTESAAGEESSSVADTAQASAEDSLTSTPESTEAPVTQTEEITTETQSVTSADETTTAESSAEETETETETEKYVDLSSEKTRIPQNNLAYVDVSAQGSGGGNVFLELSGDEIKVSSWNADHDCINCEACGFVTHNSKSAFHMCTEGQDNPGIIIELKKPIYAKVAKDIQITYMSSVNLRASSFRVMPVTMLDTSGFSNVCPGINNAYESWRTVSLGVSDMKTLADPDGYIRAFKLYFRDKDNAEVYINSVSITCEPELQKTTLREIATFEAVPGNSFYKNGALANIANEIVNRLDSAGVKADVNVRCVRYVPNGYVKDGSIVYNVTFTYGDQTLTLQNIEAEIPRVKNCYLEISDGDYGVQRDSKDQWKTSLDDAGILTLRDNVITTVDGICDIDYAILDKDSTYYDVQKWYAPQGLDMDSKGFSFLYINALMDYGTDLVKGDEYRIVIRAKTWSGNYVIHLDIPFTYAPMSADVVEKLNSAVDTIKNGSFSCGVDCTDRIADLSAQARELVGIDGIEVIPVITSNGVTCAWVDFYLTYTKNISTDRLEGDGAYYDCIGEAYRISGINVPCAIVTESTIKQVSPADGKFDVIIASEAIINHMGYTAEQLASLSYTYGEFCTPPPVRLEWSDEGAAEGKIYTVYLSENADYSNPFSVVETTECFAEVTNLKAGKQYYWIVESDGVRSVGASFITSNKYPRCMDVDGVSNIRDIGGYVTLDGKTVKQGLLYRSAWLDQITAAGKETLLVQLGVKTDLDLRGESKVSPLGEETNLIATSVKHYHWAFEEYGFENMRVAIAAFADINNYPMLYHCYIGRDRTGTVTALILGILGVDEETVKLEYMMSLNSEAGNGDATSYATLYQHMTGFIEGLKDYGGNTFNESAEAYCLHIGVTPEEIATIKSIMLE